MALQIINSGERMAGGGSDSDVTLTSTLTLGDYKGVRLNQFSMLYQVYNVNDNADGGMNNNSFGIYINEADVISPLISITIPPSNYSITNLLAEITTLMNTAISNAGYDETIAWTFDPVYTSTVTGTISANTFTVAPEWNGPNTTVNLLLGYPRNTQLPYDSAVTGTKGYNLVLGRIFLYCPLLRANCYNYTTQRNESLLGTIPIEVDYNSQINFEPKLTQFRALTSKNVNTINLYLRDDFGRTVDTNKQNMVVTLEFI